MGTRISLSNVRIEDVRPYGWPEKKGPGGVTTSQGHEFEMGVTLRFSKFLSTGKTQFFKSNDSVSVIEWAQKGTWGNPAPYNPIMAAMPVLEWCERIRWYDVSATGAWTYVNEDNVDMLSAASSIPKTFAGFYDLGVTGRGWSDPWHFAISSGQVCSATKPPGWTDEPDNIKRSTKLAHHYRRTGIPLDIITTDRPGLTKNPSGGNAMGGAGLTVHVNKPSRVRAIHFKLGFQGTTLETRATQILETQNGVPTMCKFIKQGITDAQLEDPNNHAKWRSQINKLNYTAAGNFDFDL